MNAPTYTATDRAMRAVYDSLAACPALRVAVDATTLRDVLQWSDANGDYYTMSRNELLRAFRTQMEGSK